ncbi:DEAD/DEAH box helicase [Nostocoides japonicum]
MRRDEWSRRDDRPRRDEWSRREDRTSREDRPRREEWTHRDERTGHEDRRGFAERPRRESRPHRDGRSREQDRPARHTGPRHIAGNDPWREREERHARAEAERVEADVWTAYRPKAAVAAEVTEDNGFAALGLPERLVERLARDGITEPFPIQAATIPDALAGRDVLGRGQTGSGKTLAFGLPTLARLAGGRSRPKQPRSVVLVPTRELAMQVADALEPLVHVLGLRHKLVAGGLSYEPQISALARGVDLLVATPGRLGDLLERGAVELDGVEVAILDEADHMADMGFLPEVTAILDRMPAGGQRLLFSATLDRGVDGLVERYLTDPVVHSTDDATASVETMEHHLFLVEPQHKKVVTAWLAARPGRTVVFVRTKLGADRVALQLREAGVMAAAIHGGLTQAQRNRVLGAFREGTLPVLVATDVAARGIHVDDVALVLQADPPADHKDYLHRSGRTARAGEEGAVVTLALPHQRRTMERLLAEAGVETKGLKTAPGDDAVAAAGGREPSGEPISDAELQAVVAPHRSPRRGRGGRQGGARPQGQSDLSGPASGRGRVARGSGRRPHRSATGRSG